MDVFQINKLKKRLHNLIRILLFFLLLSTTTDAQQTKYGNYGVPVLQSSKIYRKHMQSDSNHQMMELKAIAPGIVYDLRYASADNFVKTALYPASTKFTFLRLQPARALSLVQKELNEKGMSLKIFDAYRPYSVTVKFWELIKDERYVANPTKGSGHNRGLAVDLTIIKLNTGKELDMGTGFDNFSDTAHHTFTALPETVLQNRKLLKEVMLKYGFKLLETEWWHYSWPNDRNYEVLDIEFKKLLKESKR